MTTFCSQLINRSISNDFQTITRWMICKKQYEKDFCLVLIAVVGQDCGKHILVGGVCNVINVVQAR